MQVSTARGRRVQVSALMIAAMLVCVVAGLMLPGIASAKSYKVAPVTIDATVETDGTIDVVDTRTMEFDGQYDYVYWDFPMGDNKQGSYIIDGISEVTESGEEIAYTQTSDETTVKNKATRVPGTYFVAETSSQSRGPDTKLYIYFDKEDTTASFRIRYRAVDMVDAHQDTGEMYWMYVAGNHNVVFRDVDVNITLPVPAGTKIVTSGTDTNVRGWDQGGIYGSVNVNGDGSIHIHRDKIAMGEYGEARSTFPVAWLTGKVPSTDKHLDTILEEQNVWAKKTSEMHTKSDLKRTGGGITILLIDGIVLTFSLLAFFRWGRQYVPDYDEKYCREVPSRDHPVVLGEVWAWGKIEDRYFAANMMRLASLGAIRVDEVEPGAEDDTAGRHKSKTVADYVIRLCPDVAARIEDPIDKSAYALLQAVSGGEESFPFSKLEEFGKAHPEEFSELGEAWRTEIKTVSKNRGFFESTGVAGKRVLVVIGFILLALSGFVYVPFASGYESLYLAFAAGVSFICAGIIIVCGFRMKRRSEEAADLQVRLLAFERWLEDFSMLDEKPTADIDEWKNFVIVSEVFGIDGQVLDEMDTTVPDVAVDERLRPVRFWCEQLGRGEAKTTPAAYITKALAALGGIGAMGAGFGGGTSVSGEKPPRSEKGSRGKETSRKKRK